MDGWKTDAYPWQKLTWPMARWANNQFIFLYFRSSSHLSKLTHFWQFSVSESLSKRLQHYFQMNLKSFLVRSTHYGLLSFCYSTVKINVTSTSTNTGTCTYTSKRRRGLILQNKTTNLQNKYRVWFLQYNMTHQISLYDIIVNEWWQYLLTSKFCTLKSKKKLNNNEFTIN